jgi:hypothetical protein
VRLPPFCPDRPAVWFAQAEAQFELSAITRQQTTINYMVSQVNQRQVAEVEDIITLPPEHKPYDRLNAELVCRFFSSRQRRVRQLLSHGEIGVRNPSQFLRHLKGLAQTSQRISFSPSGPAHSHRTCKPYLPARLRAV